MNELVYLLCFGACSLCAAQFAWMYGQRRSPLLLWTSVGFMGLSINNALLCVDLVLVPAIDLSAWRAVAGSAASLVLVGGLLWERRWW